MPTTSAARIAANQKNAQRSTGPTTAEGKARSRANAVKHGLTGAGIALPTEDAAAVESRFLELQIEMAPRTLEASLLVRQVALMSIRLDRAAIQESAAISLNIRHAEVEFDLVFAAEIDRLFNTIETNPADHRRRLLTTHAGVTRLIDALGSVRVQLETGAYKRWGTVLKQKVDAYLGGSWVDFPVSRSDALLVMMSGDSRFVDPDEIAAIPKKAARIEWARLGLIEMIDVELARLHTHRAGLDSQWLDENRRGAAARALFDPSPEANLARKYESAARRDFHRALRDLRELPPPPPEALADDAPVISVIEPAPTGLIEREVSPVPNLPNEPNAICPNEPSKSATAPSRLPNPGATLPRAWYEPLETREDRRCVAESDTLLLSIAR